MIEGTSQFQIKHLKKDDILCREGDQDNDLYLIDSGKLLICLRKKAQVIPLAILGPDEYFGELSFFDQRGRSANAICIEDAKLFKISVKDVGTQFPQWLQTMAHNMSNQLRQLDEVVTLEGVRKTKAGEGLNLTPEEEKHYREILERPAV